MTSYLHCFNDEGPQFIIILRQKKNNSYLAENTVSPLRRPDVNLLNPNPTGHVMHQQFNIQQLYVLPTLYLCVLYLSENTQRLVPLTA